MKIEFRNVDYNDAQQGTELCMLLDDYAAHQMGGGKRIDKAQLEKLPQRLAEFPTSFSIIGYVDDNPAALANCFYGFSTFVGRRLVNIHDLMVREQFRGMGLSQKLLEEIEKIAKQNDCCKLTLEVLDQNSVAIGAYKKFGFEGYELDPEHGRAIFWQKRLA